MKSIKKLLCSFLTVIMVLGICPPVSALASASTYVDYITVSVKKSSPEYGTMVRDAITVRAHWIGRDASTFSDFQNPTEVDKYLYTVKLYDDETEQDINTVLVGQHTYKIIYEQTGESGNKENFTNTVLLTGVKANVNSVSVSLDSPTGGASSFPEATLNSQQNLVRIDSLSWTVNGETAATPVVAGNTYTATLTLGIIDTTNYKFADDIFVSGFTKESNTETQAVFTKSFTPTIAVPSIAITVNAPVAGAALSNSAATDTTGVTVNDNAASWNPNAETADYDTAYTVTVPFSLQSGYELAEGATATVNGSSATIEGNSVTYTFTTQKLKAAASDVTVTYDGQSHSIAVEVKNGKDDTPATNATVVYCETSNGNFTTTNPGYTTGTHTVYYKVQENGVDAIDTVFSATVTVNPKHLAVTANSATKQYGFSDPALTYTVSGLVGDDTASSVFTGALSRASGEILGSYAIGAGSLAVSSSDAAKYVFDSTVDFTSANLTVTTNPGFLVGTPVKAAEVLLTDENGKTVTRTYSSDYTSFTEAGEGVTGGAVVVYNGNSTATVTSPVSLASYSKVTVYVDGKALDPTYYSLAEGSTKVIIGNKYLKTLSTGVYTVDVESSSGSDKAYYRGFVKVTAYATSSTSTPHTGDTSALGLYVTLLGLSAVSVAAVAAVLIRRRSKEQ